MSKDLVTKDFVEQCIKDQFGELKNVLQDNFKRAYGQTIGPRATVMNVCFFIVFTWFMHFFISKQVAAEILLLPTGIFFLLFGLWCLFKAMRSKTGVTNLTLTIVAMVFMWASVEYFQSSGILPKLYKCTDYYIRQIQKEKLDGRGRGN